MVDDILASSPEMEKHEQLLGRVAVQWTRMHEIMALAFGYLVSPDNYEARGLAAWHALKNDRAQRDMLRAVAQAALPPNDECRQAIEWATGQLVPKENDRNNALHSPYTLTIDDGKLKVIPIYFSGNQRAAALKDRDLAVELESYAKNFRKIGDYMWRVVGRLSQGKGNVLGLVVADKLPPPPTLPKPAQAMTRKRPKRK